MALGDLAAQRYTRRIGLAPLTAHAVAVLAAPRSGSSPPGPVDHHVSAVLAKLGVPTRGAANRAATLYTAGAQT